MPSNYKTLNPDYDSEDSTSSQYIDLDDRFINDAWILERFVGNNLFVSGFNNNGELAQGDRTNRSSPVQVGALTDWVSIGNGELHFFGIKRDGTLWAWGYNSDGELGDFTITHRSSPVQVGAGSTWKQASGGGYHSALLKTNGTLWSTGNNGYGQLGLNDTTHRSGPTQIGSLTNWKQVSTGNRSTAAIKTDGTLWTWGSNNNGRLGLNDLNHRSSPVQVGSLTNWKQVSCGTYHVAAVKTDGTLWTWGYNQLGHLGNGTNGNSYSSPIQIGTLTNWNQVAAFGGGTLAIKNDGTLWAIGGQNTYGSLGLGDTTSRSSPVQVGSLTNWKTISGTSSFSITTVKTDGTLWAWGANFSGELGQGNTTHRSSPTQVGSLTNWKKSYQGVYTLTAITYTEIS